jgi:hypothetical protein
MSYGHRDTKINAEELMHTNNTVRTSRFMKSKKGIFKKPAVFSVWKTKINIQHLGLWNFTLCSGLLK